jgi:hypothetical protein
MVQDFDRFFSSTTQLATSSKRLFLLLDSASLEIMLTFPKGEFKEITGYGCAAAAEPTQPPADASIISPATQLVANASLISLDDAVTIPTRTAETSKVSDDIASPVIHVGDASASTSPILDTTPSIVEMAGDAENAPSAMVDKNPDGSHLLNVGPLRNYLNITGNRVLRQILDTFSIEQKKLFKEVNSTRPEKSCISTSFRFKHQITAPGSTPPITYNLDSIMIKYGGMQSAL